MAAAVAPPGDDRRAPPDASSPGGVPSTDTPTRDLTGPHHDGATQAFAPGAPDAPTSRPFAPGETVAGRFRIVRFLAGAGWGRSTRPGTSSCPTGWP